jgi:hypothetical protein
LEGPSNKLLQSRAPRFSARTLGLASRTWAALAAQRHLRDVDKSIGYACFFGVEHRHAQERGNSLRNLDRDFDLTFVWAR